MGVELADFLHPQCARVSVVNPACIKAYGASELARNKTDKLDAGLIAHFCRAHLPPPWVPAAAHLRKLRELVGLPNIAGFTPKALAAFVARMTTAGKPPKAISVAVARKLLVYAYAVIRTQQAFGSSADSRFPA